MCLMTAFLLAIDSNFYRKWISWMSPMDEHNSLHSAHTYWCLVTETAHVPDREEKSTGRHGGNEKLVEHGVQKTCSASTIVVR